MTAAFRQRIAHPCAWKAEELRRDSSWIYELSGAEIAEIEAALKAVNQADVKWYVRIMVRLSCSGSVLACCLSYWCLCTICRPVGGTTLRI